MAHCVNRSSEEFKALVKEVNINPIILAAKVSLWQESNGLDKFPTSEELTITEKEDYFQHFLERKPVGKIDDRLIEVDCRSASDAGLYTFSFSDGSVVKARYSFAYKKIGDEWLISSHHSSGMPEKPEASGTAAKVAVHEKPAVKTAERSQAREDFHNEIPTRAQGWVRYP